MKRINVLLIFIAIFCLNNLSAQKEGNIWYFGENAGLNFNQGCKVRDSNTAMVTFEGSATICDENGDLIMYTNGGGRTPFSAFGQFPGLIWRSDHTVMYDMGITEGGGFSSSQSAIIIPKPSDDNNFYVFTMGELEATLGGGLGRGLSYFEVDMDMGGGQGDVVDYQQTIEENAVESLDAIPHTNGKDYWFAINRGYHDIDIYSVDELGIAFHGTTTLRVPGVKWDGHSIRFSPDGTKFYARGLVFDFDASTGQLSNPTITNVESYGMTFSPNSQYLYFTKANEEVYRYDVKSSNFPNTEEFVGRVQGGFLYQLQVAPDGNVYGIFSLPGGEISLYAILCPNGDSPCIKENVVDFSDVRNPIYPFIGFTNFMDSYFSSDELNNELQVCIDGSQLEVCSGTPVTLTASHYLEETFEWSTGERTKSITVDRPGTYRVTVSDLCCNSGETMIEILDTNGGKPELKINGDLLVCNNEPVTLTAESDFLNSVIWSNGSTDSSISVATAGDYTATGMDNCGNTYTETVTVRSIPSVQYMVDQPDSLTCQGPVQVSITTNADDISWTHGPMSADISIEDPGIYYFTLTSECETLIDSVEVLEGSTFPELNILGDTELCPGESLELVLSTTFIETFEWSTGSTDNSITITDGGEYKVMAVDSCGNTIDESITITSTEALEYDEPSPEELKCNGQVDLVITTNADEIEWSTGDNTAIITVNQSGTYTYTLTTACEEIIDSVEIVAQEYNATLNIVGDSLICDGAAVTLSAQTEHIESLEWSTGSNDTELTITESGTYELTAVDSCGNIYNETIQVRGADPIQFTLNEPEAVYCTGSSDLAITTNADSFVWSTGEETSNITVSAAGYYTFTISNECYSVTDSIFVLDGSPPSGEPILELMGDTVLCQGESLDLTTRTEFIETMEWSTGSTSPNISISDEGTYKIYAIDSCGNLHQRSINVIELEDIDYDMDIPDSLFCANEVMLQVYSNVDSIVWEDGSRGFDRVVYEAGTYEFTVYHQCESITDFIEVSDMEIDHYIPNVFTPDGDGLEDEFITFWSCPDFQEFQLTIHDRWGNMMFETDDVYQPWDGKFENLELNPDVYVYMVRGVDYKGDDVRVCGDVTILK